MIEFIEKNKRLLFSYRVILQILGWILLCMGGVGFALLYMEYFQTGGKVTLDGTFGMFKRSYDAFINIGLVSLGLAQFVRYLCGDDRKMGLLLRYGDKIFYVYAALAVWQVAVEVWLVAAGRMGGNSSDLLHWLLFSLPVTLLYKTAKVLILIGLAQFLKQLITTIEDSRLNASASPHEMQN